MPDTTLSQTAQPSGMLNESQPENESQEGGYCVEFYVYPDGTYGVGKPEPIDHDEEDEEDEDVQKTPDLTAALKTLLNVVKNNPVGENPQAAFEAGYNSGAPQMGSNKGAY